MHDDNKNTNVFILTTEYHFLLAMNIIHEHYSSMANVLVFTGKRLSGVVASHLPPNVEATEIIVGAEENLKKKIHHTILRHQLANLFVFTAYRDLETYLLLAVKHRCSRHLVQDGANFYFQILKTVMISRIKETIRIYRNLWRHRIFLTELVLYKTHMAQCAFIDDVWVTNPEIYRGPKFSKKPVIKLDLCLNGPSLAAFSKYFANIAIQVPAHSVMYLSPRLTERDQILCEIAQLRSIIGTLNRYSLLIKLHPACPAVQEDQFRSAFGDCVLKNAVPAELYIASASNCCIVGVSSAALYYNNPACSYFSLIKIYQELKLFPEWIAVSFPSHVRVVETLEAFNLPDQVNSARTQG